MDGLSEGRLRHRLGMGWDGRIDVGALGGSFNGMKVERPAVKLGSGAGYTK